MVRGIMANGEDTFGCVVAFLAVAAGGYWLFNKYEIRERPEVVEIAPPLPSVRPTADIYVTTLDTGEVWSLDAGSVKGPRQKRIGWIVADHTKDKTTAARETKTAYQVDCDTGAYLTLGVVQYDKANKVLRSLGQEDFGKEPSYPPPGTVIETAINTICLPGFDASPAQGEN